MDPRVKVTLRDDGAAVSIDGFEITMTVKPSTEVLATPTPSQIEPLLPTSRITIDPVRLMSEEHLGELDVQEGEVNIIVEPRGFLGQDKFVAIASIVDELGGSYISAGKESHFVISTQ